MLLLNKREIIKAYWISAKLHYASSSIITVHMSRGKKNPDQPHLLHDRYRYIGD